MKIWFSTEQSQKLMWKSYCDSDWVIDVFFMISDYGWCVINFCFIDSRGLIRIQFFLISLMFSLRNLVKYFSFLLLRSVDKRFLRVLQLLWERFWFLHFRNFEYILFFFLIEYWKPCVIHGFVRNFAFFC